MSFFPLFNDMILFIKMYSNMSASEKRIIAMNEQLDAVLVMELDGEQEHKSRNSDISGREEDNFKKVAEKAETHDSLKRLEKDDIKQFVERK